jgi:hypothetical protein
LCRKRERNLENIVSILRSNRKDHWNNSVKEQSKLLLEEIYGVL